MSSTSNHHIDVPLLGVSETTRTSLEHNDDNRCHWGELSFALSAGFIFVGLRYIPGKHHLVFYLITLCTLVGGYVLYKMRSDGGRVVAKEWGLTLDHFKKSFLWCSGMGVLAMLVFSIWIVRGQALPYNHHLLICLALYPLWGCVQQFLIQAMIGLNLSKLLSKHPPVMVYFLTACSFSMVHFPEWKLMMGTFFLGLVLTPIYLKFRCIYPLGLYHGWLGALFYWCVLGRDPLRHL